MDKPSLYSQANDVQRCDAREVVKEYANLMNQHSDGKHSLLDVGSGSGDVLMEILVPALAKGFSHITGVDISHKMVEYSRMRYADLKGVHFKELDIETDQLPVEFQDKFHRVVSFYTLHWIKNQRKSLENIFKCLRSNGDCLLVFLGSNSIFDVYTALARHNRWRHYVKGLDRMFSPLFNHPQIGEVYESLLEEVGFVGKRVEVKEKVYAYNGFANFRDNLKAINPFPLTDLEFEEYFLDFCDHMEAMGLTKALPASKDCSFLVKYKLVVIYARKGE